MNINSGRVKYRKFTIDPAPVCEANISGKRTVTKITIMIIMLNAIIRYLNFNVNSFWNHKRNIVLRQPEQHRRFNGEIE